jgi:hypothetical protein
MCSRWFRKSNTTSQTYANQNHHKKENEAIVKTRVHTHKEGRHADKSAKIKKMNRKKEFEKEENGKEEGEGDETEMC